MSGFYLMVAYGADPGFLSACDQTLQIVLRACRYITPTFMLIALVYTIGRGFVSGHGLSMDWGPILKAVWIFFLLFFYKELIDTLSMGIAGFTRMFATLDGSTAASALGATISTSETLSQKTVVEQGVQEITNLLKTITSFSLTNILLQLITGEVVLLIRQIMQFIQQFILGFLFVCGPISLCLSVVPAFGQLAIKWLQNFIAVQLWGLSFALLDLLYTFYTASNTTFGGVFAAPAAAESDTRQLIVSVAFIMLYLMVPYLTSLFIGSSAAQGFVGSVVGMATSAAAAGAGVSAGMAGGGHGVSGAIGRAIGSSGSSGGGGSGGGSGDSGGGSNGSTAPAPGVSSASAGLPSITMSDALNPSYRQRPSGLWTA